MLKIANIENKFTFLKSDKPSINPTLFFLNSRNLPQFICEFHALCRGETKAKNIWSQMLNGQNWILPKEMNANRFFPDSDWLEIWEKKTVISLYGIEWRERGFRRVPHA